MPEALSPDPTLLAEIHATHAFYAALAPRLDPAHALGGTLLLAGQLQEQAVPLIRAANIAGAATLTVSASTGELRGAMRNGVIDFIVTSLDEALRILKNELRKRLPVAVGVQTEPAAMGNEMMVRGVQPDLLTPYAAAVEPLCARALFLERGALLVEPQEEDASLPLRIWPVPSAWSTRMNELDAKLGELLPAGAQAQRRWLRLSPRYLGAPARRLRSSACDNDLAQAIQTILQS